MLFTILLFAITLGFIWRWKVTSTFQKLGIPGPPPNIFFGNLLELYWKGPLKCHEEWVKKYGRVVGYYLGMTPAILVADPILLKNIYINDFNKFINREPFDPIYKYSPHHKFRQSIIHLTGDAWKSVRSTLAPTFTSAKIKQKSGSMDSCLKIMIDKMRNAAVKNETLDIFDVFQRTTLDVISRTAFGLKTDIQTNMKSRFSEATKILLIAPYKNPLLFIGLSFPLLRRLCQTLQNLILIVKFGGSHPFHALRKIIVQVLQHRKENPQMKNSDCLQIMIDNGVSDDRGKDLSQLEARNENELKSEKLEAQSKKTQSMTDLEIIASAISVLLAGYDTTSTALAFTTYFLAKHQDKQEKLFAEISTVLQEKNKIDYSAVNKMEYLDKVICESMRLKPPLYLFSNRYALTDVKYDNIKIPKGMLIRFPTYLMHHDPEFWENPECFDPERFSTKPNSNGITYLPFGIGPRNCIAMRFAQLETKLILAYVIYHFRISLADIHKENLPISIRVRTLTPRSVCVKLEERTSQ